MWSHRQAHVAVEHQHNYLSSTERMGASCCTSVVGVEERHGVDQADEGVIAARPRRERDPQRSSSPPPQMVAARDGGSQRHNSSKASLALFTALYDLKTIRLSAVALMKGVGAPALCTPDVWLRGVSAALSDASFQFQALLSRRQQQQPSSSSSSSEVGGVLVKDLQYFVVFDEGVMNSAAAESMRALASADGDVLNGEPPSSPNSSRDGSDDLVRPSDEEEDTLGAMFDRSALVGGGGKPLSSRKPPVLQYNNNSLSGRAGFRRSSASMPTTTTLDPLTPSSDREPSWEVCSKVLVGPAHRAALDSEKRLTAAILSLVGSRVSPSDAAVDSSNNHLGADGYCFLTMPLPTSTFSSGSSSSCTVVYTTHAAAVKDRQRSGSSVTACRQGVLTEGILVSWNASATTDTADGTASAVFRDRQDWYLSLFQQEAPLGDATRSLLQRIAQLSR